jgi:hypothetical protein
VNHHTPADQAGSTSVIVALTAVDGADVELQLHPDLAAIGEASASSTILALAPMPTQRWRMTRSLLRLAVRFSDVRLTEQTLGTYN